MTELGREFTIHCGLKFGEKGTNTNIRQQAVLIRKVSKQLPSLMLNAEAGAGKLIKGRKRHILVDTLGLLLVVVVTAAAVQDRDGARILLKQLPGSCKKLRKVWVDGGYRG